MCAAISSFDFSEDIIVTPITSSNPTPNLTSPVPAHKMNAHEHCDFGDYEPLKLSPYLLQGSKD